MDGILIAAVTAGDQVNNADHVATNVTDVAGWKAVSNEPTNDSILSQGHDLEVFRIVLFEVTLGSGGWAIQLVLELFGDFDTDKKTLIRFFTHSVLLFSIAPTF
jgi:hypothetical protein